MRSTTIPIGLLLALSLTGTACFDADGEMADTSSTSETSTAEETGTSSETGEPDPTTSSTESTGGSSSEESGETGPGVEDDPDYPAPDANGNCPPEFEKIMLNADAGICVPPCGNGGSCPGGATGNSFGLCLHNPNSSIQMCETSDDCPNPGETCQPTTGGFDACFLPPSHCVLACQGGFTCPDAMECIDTHACWYPDVG